MGAPWGGDNDQVMVIQPQEKYVNAARIFALCQQT